MPNTSAPIAIFIACGKSLVRRHHIKEQLESHCLLNGHLIKATYPEDLDPRLDHSNLTISLNEHCCALTHQHIYESIINANLPAAIVLEDDASLSANFSRLLPLLSEMSKSSDVILLGRSSLSAWLYRWSTYLVPVRPLISTECFELGTPKKVTASGAVGYFITRRGAEQLRKLNADGRRLADDWPHFSLSLRLHEIRPLVVFEERERLGSDIEATRSGTQAGKRRKLHRLTKIIKGLRDYIRFHLPSNT